MYCWYQFCTVYHLFLQLQNVWLHFSNHEHSIHRKEHSVYIQVCRAPFLKKSKSWQKLLLNLEKEKKSQMQTYGNFWVSLIFSINLPKNLIIHEIATNNWLWIAAMTVRSVHCRQKALNNISNRFNLNCNISLLTSSKQKVFQDPTVFNISFFNMRKCDRPYPLFQFMQLVIQIYTLFLL